LLAWPRSLRRQRHHAARPARDPGIGGLPLRRVRTHEYSHRTRVRAGRSAGDLRMTVPTASVTTLSEYQAEARRTVRRELTDDQRLLDAAAGLAEEAGEVLAHV